MNESLAIWWWVATGTVVIAELATGTVYLLMVALGLATGAVVAHLGWGLNAQIMSAAFVSSLATTVWHFYRGRNRVETSAHQSRDVNLDIGERVQVPTWAATGATRISYRGAQWSARLSPGAVGTPGEHTITAIEGSTLILTPVTD